MAAVVAWYAAERKRFSVGEYAHAPNGVLEVSRMFNENAEHY
jgi:hypothetical protein